MTTINDQTATVNGDTEIHYAEHTTGTSDTTGDPVLLLHGGGPGVTGASNFAANTGPLAEHFRVIVPDLPGYGESSKTIDKSDPFGSLADGIRGLMDTLGIASAVLVGNSYGGAAALRLALDTPDRVSRLVLMGPGGIGTTRALPTPGLNSLLDYYKGEGPTRAKLTEFVRGYLVHDPNTVTEEMLDNRWQESIKPEVVANPPLTRPSGKSAPKTLWKMDLTRDKRLQWLKTPTLVLWGTHDRVNRPSGAKMLADAMENAEALLVANAGHWVQFERANLFNKLVTDYVKGELE